MGVMFRCRRHSKGKVVSSLGADRQAVCQAFFKSIEGEDWGELHGACKEVSRAVGVKKPQEAQEAKAPRMRVKNSTIQCVKRTSLKDPIAALEKALK